VRKEDEEKALLLFPHLEAEGREEIGRTILLQGDYYSPIDPTFGDIPFVYTWDRDVEASEESGAFDGQRLLTHLTHDGTPVVAVYDDDIPVDPDDVDGAVAFLRFYKKVETLISRSSKIQLFKED